MGDVGVWDVGGAEEMITLECKSIHSSKTRLWGFFKIRSGRKL